MKEATWRFMILHPDDGWILAAKGNDSEEVRRKGEETMKGDGIFVGQLQIWDRTWGEYRSVL